MIVIRTYNLQSLKRDPSTDECYSARARRVNRDQDDKKKRRPNRSGSGFVEAKQILTVKNKCGLIQDVNHFHDPFQQVLSADWNTNRATVTCRNSQT